MENTNERVRNVAEERLEDKINLIQDEVKQIKDNLNTVIKRMNDFHKWMDLVMDKTSRCYDPDEQN